MGVVDDDGGVGVAFPDLSKKHQNQRKEKNWTTTTTTKMKKKRMRKKKTKRMERIMIAGDSVPDGGIANDGGVQDVHNSSEAAQTVAASLASQKETAMRARLQKKMGKETEPRRLAETIAAVQLAAPLG